MAILKISTACGLNEFWSERPYLCGFKCRPNGIDIKCDDTRKHPGCDCLFGFYLNMDTMKCEKIKCKNMNCIGRANEQLFECESSRRDRCECTERITMDCNHGCMCMNGYCRVNGTCVKRSCHHSVYS